MKGDAAMRRLAFDLLEQYDVDVAGLALIARSFNNVYRVTSRTGQRYALRVSPRDRFHRPGAEAVEAAWVSELHAGGFPTPAALPTTSGEVVSRASRADVPGRRSAVLFEWATGRPLLERTTVERVSRLGALIATLHGHAQAHPTPQPDVFVTNRVLYFSEDILDGVGHGSLFADARDAAQRVLDGLWRGRRPQAHLIHGDVHGRNVLASRNLLTVIDFQDLAWGLDVIDLSITTAALRHFRPEQRQLDEAVAVAALRAGYEQLRPWPDISPYTWQALEACRMLNVFNFTVGLDPDRPPEYVERHVAIQRSFLEESRRQGVGG